MIQSIGLRIRYAIVILVTIGCGLASRRYLPTPFSFIGDLLWAVVLLLCIAIIRPRSSARMLGSIAALLAIFVECSHLIDAAPLRAIRPTIVGRLVLGRGFALTDIGLYLIGVALGLVIKRIIDASMQNKELSLPGRKRLRKAGKTS